MAACSAASDSGKPAALDGTARAAAIAAAHATGAKAAGKGGVQKAWLDKRRKAAKQELATLQATFKQLRASLTQLESSVERLMARDRVQAGGRPSQELLRAYSGMTSTQERLQKLAGEGQALDLRVRATYGPGDRYLLLAPASARDEECLSSGVVIEKRTRGGATTSTPKSYSYRLCWGQAAYQIEADPAGWAAGEAAAKGEAPPAAPAGSASGAPQSLGTWRGWLPVAQLPAYIYATSPYHPSVSPQEARNASALEGWVTGLASGAFPSPLPLAEVAMVYDATSVNEDSNYIAALKQHVTGKAKAAPLPSPPTQCTSGPVSARRRAVVFHVCPGLQPADVHADWTRRWGRPLLGDGEDNSPSSSSTRRVLPPAFLRFLPSRGATWNAAPPPPPPPKGAPSPQQLLHVEEDGLCTYYLWLATPHACEAGVTEDAAAAGAAPAVAVGDAPARSSAAASPPPVDTAKHEL